VHHVAAYTGTVNTTADVALAAVADSVLSRSVSSNRYQFQDRVQLLAANANCATLSRIKLDSPTLRQINQPYIRPITVGALFGSNGQVAWFADQPLMIPALEDVAPLATGTNAGGDPGFCFLWVSPGIRPIPPGQCITVRATATITAVASAWTLGNFTLEQGLPNGRYAVVGMEAIGTTLLAARLAFPNQIMRPGCPGHATVAQYQDWRLMSRRLGVWGEFNNTAPPSIEIFCSAADTAQELYLQLVPLGVNVGGLI